MSYCTLELKNRGVFGNRYYIRVCQDERENRSGSKTEIGPIYFKPDERIETMATNNLNETVRNLPSNVQKQVIDFYNEEKKKREGKNENENEKEEDVSQTWKDTAAAAGGKRSKKSKKTKKVKRSKKAKKSMKNKKR